MKTKSLKEDAERQKLPDHQRCILAFLHAAGKDPLSYVIKPIEGLHLPFRDIIMYNVNEPDTQVFLELKSDTYYWTGRLVNEAVSSINVNEVPEVTDFVEEFYKNKSIIPTIVPGDPGFDVLRQVVQDCVLGLRKGKLGLGATREIGENDRHYMSYLFFNQGEMDTYYFLRTYALIQYTLSKLGTVPFSLTRSHRNSSEWYTISLLLQRDDLEKDKRVVKWHVPGIRKFVCTPT